MIPNRAFALAMLGPLALAIAALIEPSLVWPMIATDLGIALYAIVDAGLAWPRRISVRRTAPEVLSMGRAHGVTLALRVRGRRGLRVRITDDLFDDAEQTGLPAETQLEPNRWCTVEYRIKPTRRGAYRLGAHHVRHTSPLGLWTRQYRIPAEHEIRVYPDIEAVRAFEVLARKDRELALLRASRRRGGESEFECLREYQRDDEFRAIDWRATARRSKLITRQYQREQNQSLMFMLDAGRLMTAQSQGISLYDHALNAALMLAHVAVRGGDNVGVMRFADDVVGYVGPKSGRRATHRLVQASFDVHPTMVETNFPRAFEQLGCRLRKRSLILIFTQVIDSVSAESLVRSIRALQPRHLPVCVLFRDVDIERLAQPTTPLYGRTDDIELYTQAAAAEILTWRDQIIRTLKSHNTFVLDVASRDLTPALITRYLEIKARQLL